MELEKKIEKNLEALGLKGKALLKGESVVVVNRGQVSFLWAWEYSSPTPPEGLRMTAITIDVSKLSEEEKKELLEELQEKIFDTIRVRQIGDDWIVVVRPVTLRDVVELSAREYEETKVWIDPERHDGDLVICHEEDKEDGFYYAYWDSCILIKAYAITEVTPSVNPYQLMDLCKRFGAQVDFEIEKLGAIYVIPREVD